MMPLEDFLRFAPLVRVEIARVRGSSPREEGAFMLVSESALWGTIGGGQLEYMALDEARKMLAEPCGASRDMEVPLGPEIGQCCGGHVRLKLTVLDEHAKAALMEAEAARVAALHEVLIFGAGHVGRALARAMQPLPVRAKLIDGRSEELALAPEGTETLLTPLPEAELREARAGAAYVIATHDHALDFLLTKEALERGDAAYVGMIGSKTKRARFDRWAECGTRDLVCPMAAEHLGDRRPEVIAAYVTAEILTVLAAHEADVETRETTGDL